MGSVLLTALCCTRKGVAEVSTQEHNMSSYFECSFFFIGSLFGYRRPFPGFWSSHNIARVCVLLLTWSSQRREDSSFTGSLLAAITPTWPATAVKLLPWSLALGALCTCLRSVSLPHLHMRIPGDSV